MPNGLFFSRNKSNALQVYILMYRFIIATKKLLRLGYVSECPKDFEVIHITVHKLWNWSLIRTRFKNLNILSAFHQAKYWSTNGEYYWPSWPVWLTYIWCKWYFFSISVYLMNAENITKAGTVGITDESFTSTLWCSRHCLSSLAASELSRTLQGQSPSPCVAPVVNTPCV